MKENYLNEERFTRSYIRDKFYIKHWVKTKSKCISSKKEITEKLITKSFDEIDEDDYVKTVQRLYENYVSKLKGIQAYQKKSKP